MKKNDAKNATSEPANTGDSMSEISAIPNRMKSVICHAPGHFEIVDRPIPEPSPNEVLIETKAVGLCMSDIYLMMGQMPDVTFPTERFGHEPSGIVRAVGKDVIRFKPGDRVTTLWARGGFMQYADYYCNDANYTFHLPPEIPFAHGLCEPLSAVARSICGIGILPGDTVAVVGVGYFGLLMVQAANLLGAWRVVALDRTPGRLQLATDLGAHAAFNVTEDGVHRAVTEITADKGFDVVIECAGVEGVWDTCVDLVRTNGSVFAYGWHTRPETINPCKWHKGFNVLSNSTSSTFDMTRWWHMCEVSIEWLRRGFWRVDKLITGITAREDMAAAIEALGVAQE